MFGEDAKSYLLPIVLLSLAIYKAWSRLRAPMPPGPPSLPLLGAILEHPKSEYWRTYAEWGRKYSKDGMISFHLLGRRMVVINTRPVAEDLFNRRSSIYNDRPCSTMGAVLMGRAKSLICLPYDERCKSYRKFMHQFFNAQASQRYFELEEEAAKNTINRIIQDPKTLRQQLRRNAAFIIMKVAFGYTITDENDHFVHLSEETLRVASLGQAPGWLVDSFPILRFLPDWFPGAGFKRKAKAWGVQLMDQSLVPHEWVKKQMENGTATSCFTSELLQDEHGHVKRDPALDDMVLWSAGFLYAAGADTTVSVMNTFFLCMLTNPEVQRRAQAAVDEFMEHEHRLPTLKDYSQGAIPYLSAIIQELLRWNPPAPMALFHATARNDVYNGYFIPAKTTIVGNIWAMMHDPTVYPEPEVFNPDRFSEVAGASKQPDPRQIVFGFGRRVCPGLHLAEHSVWIQIALALASLQIEKAVDDKGQVIEPEIGFTTSLVCYVKPFPCKITPREGRGSTYLRENLGL